MKNIFNILIADNNPRVRGFLKRELACSHYRILMAKNSNEVIKKVFSQEHLDLLILDPDLTGAEESALLKKLKNRIPALPIVFHTLLSGYSLYLDSFNLATYVEKKGNSIELLKQVVFDILNKPDLKGKKNGSSLFQVGKT